MSFCYLTFSSPKKLYQSLPSATWGFPCCPSLSMRLWEPVFLELWAPMCAGSNSGTAFSEHLKEFSQPTDIRLPDLSGDGASDPDTQLAEQTACNVRLTLIWFNVNNCFSNIYYNGCFNKYFMNTIFFPKKLSVASFAALICLNEDFFKCIDKLFSWPCTGGKEGCSAIYVFWVSRPGREWRTRIK